MGSVAKSGESWRKMTCEILKNKKKQPEASGENINSDRLQLNIREYIQNSKYFKSDCFLPLKTFLVRVNTKRDKRDPVLPVSRHLAPAYF